MITQREAEIDSYIQQNPGCKLPNVQGVSYRGQLHDLEVFRLPTGLLTFNITNGRFVAELLAKQAKLKRKLDAGKAEDATIIQKLLLELSPDETKALKDDITINGQIEPGLITHDGAVINANRRMAILRALDEETGADKFTFIKVSRLPKGVDAKELWQIEARLQFGKDFRLAYAAVNELLKLRAGLASGLSFRQIEKALGGRYTEKQLKERIEVLKLIDQYLEAIDKKNQYHLITELRHIERFNSLHSVVRPLKDHGSASQIKDLPKVIEIGFKLIENELSHWDVRKLRKIAENSEARSELLTVYQNGVIATDLDETQEVFRQAQDIIEAQEDKDKPEKLMRRALTAVNQINPKHAAVKTSTFKTLVRDLKQVLAKFK